MFEPVAVFRTVPSGLIDLKVDRISRLFHRLDVLHSSRVVLVVFRVGDKGRGDPISQMEESIIEVSRWCFPIEIGVSPLKYAEHWRIPKFGSHLPDQKLPEAVSIRTAGLSS